MYLLPASPYSPPVPVTLTQLIIIDESLLADEAGWQLSCFQQHSERKCNGMLFPTQDGEMLFRFRNGMEVTVE